MIKTINMWMGKHGAWIFSPNGSADLLLIGEAKE